MTATHLSGLEGTNPLGFLAALGVQVAFSLETRQPLLWWSDDITPHAVVSGEFDVEQLADQTMKTLACWRNSPALNPRRPDGSSMPRADSLKLDPDDIRAFLSLADEQDPSGRLICALVAEGSLDNNGAAKPSDFYFTAGQQKFLHTARQILEGVSRECVVKGLTGPWDYGSSLPSFMWDVVDDRIYALTSDNPATDKKQTNPGPEALAFLGLSLYPVFASQDRTLTQGCSGTWKRGDYSWPLWNRPASLFAVKSLVAHAYAHPNSNDRSSWLPSWSVFRVLRSSIRRSDQGGYGTFGPAEVVNGN